MPKHKLYPETWIDKYSDHMLGYALTRLRDRDLAKDMVQESFFVALRTKENYRGEISEKNWLYLILRSRILDYYKKKREVTESQLQKSDEDSEDRYFMKSGAWNKEEAPKEWLPDKMLESKEFMGVLNACLKRLTVTQQAAFTMKYIDGNETETICKELEITSSNYWVLVHRAKLQLRKCLETNWIS